ncbi:MAG: nuclear transport factor 2 family protein [Bryobacteraceae bacterium]
MKKLRYTILFTAALLALPVLATASEEIRKAEEAWVTAITKNDGAAMGRILSDDLVYAHSTGLVESKREYIAALSSGNQKYAAVTYEDTNIRTYGDTAVVNAKVRMTGTTKGQPFDNRLLMMHVWVKQQGQWRLVAHQTTRL